MAISEILRVYS